jgi:hypothetical protein
MKEFYQEHLSIAVPILYSNLDEGGLIQLSQIVG